MKRILLLATNQAVKDRSTQVDLALAFIATFVITLAIWPKAAPRQIVRCCTDGHQWKRYSIALDDPNLEQLKDKVQRWKTPEMQPEYVTAKWQKEVAEFYENCEPCKSADCESTDCESVEADPASCESDGKGETQPKDEGPTTASISDNVITASYEVDAPEASQPMIALASHVEETGKALEQAKPLAAVESKSVSESFSDETEGNYWSTVRASAVQSMKKIEDRSENIPVVFEQLTRPSSPQLAFHCAFLFGIAAACGYMHWLRISPVRESATFHDQPLPVLARIGTFVGANILALVGALTLWI